MTSTTQPTPTTTGVSKAMVKAFFAELKKRNAPLPFTEDAKAALEAALSAAPAGDGVPGTAKSALDCVVHALMVLPVPIDGQGRRAWASLLEAQTILEALSTASTAGKG